MQGSPRGRGPMEGRGRSGARAARSQRSAAPGRSGLEGPGPAARDARCRRLGPAGASPGFWGCDPNTKSMGRFGTQALHHAAQSPAPTPGSDRGAAQGCPGTPLPASPCANGLSGWGIAAPAPLFAMGLVCALHRGSSSRGLRGGNRRTRRIWGSEPARRAGVRDAASHGACLPQSARRGLLPAKEPLNSGGLPPSKTLVIWRLLRLPSHPGGPGPRSRVGMEGTDGCRRGGCGCGSRWLCSHQRPAGPEEGEYKNRH